MVLFLLPKEKHAKRRAILKHEKNHSNSVLHLMCSRSDQISLQSLMLVRYSIYTYTISQLFPALPFANYDFLKKPFGITKLIFVFF